MEFLPGVSIEFQTGIDTKKPNTKRRGRIERTTETTKSTKVKVGQGASMLERVYLDSLQDCQSFEAGAELAG